MMMIRHGGMVMIRHGGMVMMIVNWSPDRQFLVGKLCWSTPCTLCWSTDFCALS